jgi:hypothetical protein
MFAMPHVKKSVVSGLVILCTYVFPPSRTDAALFVAVYIVRNQEISHQTMLIALALNNYRRKWMI